jgi:predicted metal-dependent peptidase
MQTRLTRADSRRMRSDLESAIEYLPGLASLALWCNFADADEDTIAFTDGQTIYAGVGYEKFSEKERRFICLHEILHIALCHPFRFLTLERQDVGFNPNLLNIAADAIINKSLENLTGLTAPAGAWTLEKIWEVLEKCEDAANSPSGKIREFSYSYRISSPTRKIANLSRSEFICVSRWSCEELYYFLKAQANNFSEFVEILLLNYAKDTLGGDLLRLNRVAGHQNISDGNKGVETEEKRIWQQRFSLLRGTMPELFQRLAGELPKTETPWEQILRSLVQTVFQETEQKNYSRPSRRWLALERDYFASAGVNLPFSPETTKKRGSRLAVALDTSGSIDESLLGRFLAEIGVLCQLNQRNLVLIIGDAEVHQIVEIEWREVANELKNQTYSGGGGTDFRPLIKAAAEFAPNALIYLTDLFGETGNEPDFPVIWATHGVSGNATWGEQIKLK